MVKGRLIRKKLITPLLIKKLLEMNFCKYILLINKFDEVSEVMNKKAPGARGPNQKNVLDYGNELRKIVGKFFNISGSGLKILIPQ